MISIIINYGHYDMLIRNRPYLVTTAFLAPDVQHSRIYEMCFGIYLCDASDKAILMLPSHFRDETIQNLDW